MAKRGTRRRGLFGTLYRPISGILNAASRLTGTTTNTVRNIVKRGVKGVNNAGRNITGSADNVVSSILTRRRNKRKSGRKTRRN